MVPTDTAIPRIAYTLALPASNSVFVHASEPIVDDGSTIAFAANGPTVSSITSVPGSSTYEALLGLSSPLSLDAILKSAVADSASVYLTMSNARDKATEPADAYAENSSLPHPTFPTSYGDYSAYDVSSANGGAGLLPPNRPTVAAATHRVSDLLISAPPSSTAAADYPPYFVWPVWAKDSRTVSLSEDEIEALTASGSASTGIGLIRAFDGSQWLRDQDITVQARENSALGGAALTLHYDTSPASTYVSDYGLWLPSHDESAFSGLVPYPDGLTVGVAENGGSSGALRNTTVDSSNAKIVSGKSFEFFYTVSGYPSSGAPLYCARLDITAGATVPDNWYRLIKPFSFQIHDLRSQKGSVTILNNVIDPTKGETVRLSYQIPSEGAVTVTVFTLDGDVVRRLYSGTEAAGDYSTSWDGRNMGGASVARGIYFVRVVGPGVDEMRKVMVVRK
jgi:hypothetical protein